jgi:hypothetical protein
MRSLERIQPHEGDPYGDLDSHVDTTSSMEALTPVAGLKRKKVLYWSVESVVDGECDLQCCTWKVF